MSKRIVTFGEIMLRLAPNGYYRFFQDDQLQATFGGGEANVAVSLANYGMDAAFVTKLPAHAIGQGAVNALRGLGVDTRSIVRGGDRIGIYYLEKGASQRGSVCIYDRAHSAIQEAQPSDFDWDAIFDGADWFHFTGITPALGSNLVEICKEACVAAKKHGVKISCDLNYRGKLWTREQARAAMTELCQYVDVCISNEEDAKDVFGIEAENTDIYGGKLNKEGYKSVAKQLADRFGFEKVAITLRTSLSASDNDWAGMLYDGENYCFSKEYHLHIVDRVGGGDSFGGGLIYALLNGKDSQSAIEFAVAASALKHSIEGDFNRVTVSEVEKLAVAGQHFLDDQFGLAQKIVDEFDYNRIVYLGNIGLKGVAQESALKTLELTAGKVATMYDSELGFRHGPKSIIDDNTLTVAYLSDDEYRRRYELDLVKEMAHQRKGNKIAVVYNHDCEGIEELADYPVQIKVGADMENVLLGLDFILFAQTIALMKSLSLGITPDNPCPTGEVNRVVKGVTLYPYTLK